MRHNEQHVYIKVGKRYKEIGKLHSAFSDWTPFPSEGLWIFKKEDGSAHSYKIADMDDLKDSALKLGSLYQFQDAIANTITNFKKGSNHDLTVEIIETILNEIIKQRHPEKPQPE